MKYFYFLIYTVVFCSFISGCASQSDVVILDERLMVMERQNQELQRQNRELQKQLSNELERIGNSSKTSTSNLRTKYAGINADIDTMRQELQLAGGRIEELSHIVDKKITAFETDGQQRQAKLDEISVLTQKLDQRLSTIEQYLNIDSVSGDRSGKGGNETGASGKKSSDDQMYADAKKAYDEGQLEKARQEFQQLIKAYPKSSNADNAQFWIGESYYREAWYEKAILEYQAVIEKYPKGNKVAAAMLKQGMAFLKIGDKSNARLILKELTKKYPKSNEATIAAKKLTEF